MIHITNRGNAIDIYVHGEITPGMARPFGDELKAANGKPITVYLHTPGGDWTEAAAMYSMVQAYKGQTTGFVQGMAASSGSFLLQAFNKRMASQNALIMVHSPSMGTYGTAEEHEVAAQVLRTVRDRLANTYSRSGQPREVIEGWLNTEKWFNAEEALTAGLIDEIDSVSEMAIAAYIDLSNFSNVPEHIRSTFKNTVRTEENYMSEINKPGADTPNRTAIVDELAGPTVKAKTEPKIDNRAEIEREASRIAEDRVKAITAAYRAGRDLGLENECQRLLDDGIAASEVPDLLIQVFAKRNQRSAAVGSLIPSGATVGFSNDDPSVVINRMAEGISAQFVGTSKVSDASREYVGWRPQAFMRAVLELKGRDTRRMQPAEIINAAMTTSDFPALLGTSANKIFLGAYEAATGSYRLIAARKDLPNFQSQDLLRAGDFPVLTQLNEGGEITFGASSEHKEVARLKTFARAISLSRQALVNDLLGAFGDLAQKAGIAAAVLENKTVWDLITANAALSDTVALFHADHGNLAGSGAAADASTIGAARAAMRI